MQSQENGQVRAQNGSCNLACSDQASNVHQQLRFMAGIWTIEQTLPYWQVHCGNIVYLLFFSKNFKKALTARFVQLYALDTGGKKS